MTHISRALKPSYFPWVLGVQRSLTGFQDFFQQQKTANRSVAGTLPKNLFDWEGIVFLDISLVFQIPCEDRCLDPQTAPEKTFRGSKHLFTRYLEDFGRLGFGVLVSYPVEYPKTNDPIHSHFKKDGRFMGFAFGVLQKPIQSPKKNTG